MNNLEQVGATPVCWSVAVLMHSAAREDGRVHIQGYDWGKTGRTLCGIRLTEYWDFEIHDYPPSEFAQCFRCRAVLKRIEANHE